VHAIRQQLRQFDQLRATPPGSAITLLYWRDEGESANDGHLLHGAVVRHLKISRLIVHA
jgi:hypothetical protein